MWYFFCYICSLRSLGRSIPNGKRCVMGLFSSKNLDSLETLLVDQIEDLYDAEQRIAQALPKMAETAHCASLKAAFEQHVRETQNHVARLEQVFQMLGREPTRKTCYAAKGLIE